MRIKPKNIQPLAVGLTAIIVSGCATAPGQSNFADTVKSTFASSDPCSNNARNIGIAAGAIGGIVIGNAVGGGKDSSKLIGAALGATIGGLIGADMDRKRCEISKVAKKYDLEITFADIKSEGEVKSVSPEVKGDGKPTPGPAEANAVIGNSVTVRDKGGAAGHFESGSDQLTPRAKEYFTAIAAQFAPATIANTQLDPKQKKDTIEQLVKRRILLVGHTDDTGSTQVNATLSEKRAKAVAAFLKQQDIPEDSIYFQGAGESLPIADNRTEEGRNVNRRVEIVELADETGFKKYLETRKPNYAFYRPQHNSEANTSALSPAPSAQVAADDRKSASSTRTPSKGKIQPRTTITTGNTTTAKNNGAAPPVAPKASINFGGSPYTLAMARIETGAMAEEKGFSLISTARADDSVLVTDCSYDRPRAVGSVKSLRDGRMYKTSEHLPQLYGKTWASDVNGNLVVLNRLAVLRDGGAPANLPELKVYADYKPGNSAKPLVNEEPAVNSYLVEKGVLYRVFPKGDGGLKCMDVLLSADGATTAKAGKLIYLVGGKNFVTDFKLQLQLQLQ